MSIGSRSGSADEGGSMRGFMMQRLCMLMEPEPGNPQEIEGVLNPTVIVRGGYGLMWMLGVVGMDALVMMFRARR